MKSILQTCFFIAGVFFLFSCNNQAPANEAATANQQETIYAQTFKTTEGWGYAVVINGKTFINQAYIPVLEGNKGFANEADAKNVAALVVNKLKKHEKPTIHLEELQQLGIR